MSGSTFAKTMFAIWLLSTLINIVAFRLLDIPGSILLAPMTLSTAATVGGLIGGGISAVVLGYLSKGRNR